MDEGCFDCDFNRRYMRLYVNFDQLKQLDCSKGELEMLRMVIAYVEPIFSELLADVKEIVADKLKQSAHNAQPKGESLTEGNE